MLKIKDIKVGEHLQVLDLSNIQPLKVDGPQRDHCINYEIWDIILLVLREVVSDALV